MSAKLRSAQSAATCTLRVRVTRIGARKAVRKACVCKQLYKRKQLHKRKQLYKRKRLHTRKQLYKRKQLHKRKQLYRRGGEPSPPGGLRQRA